MYSVVLVSSAKHVTESFNSMKLWENQKFYLKQVTSVLSEALKELPDVLIYPYNSDNLSGCELSRKLFMEKSKTKVVLYGRKSFDSIKSAINSRAWGYLSMPLELNDFYSLLFHLNEYFDAEASDIAPVPDANLLKEAFFPKLLSGSFKNQAEALKEFEFLDLPVLPERDSVSIVKFTINNFSSYLNEKWKYGKDALYVAVDNFTVKNRPDIVSLPIATSENHIYVAIFGLSEDEITTKYNEAIVNLKDIMGIEITFSLLRTYSSTAEIFTPVESSYMAELVPVVKGSETYDPTSGENAINIAKKYIENNFNKEICLDDVSRYVDLSTAYFSRLFKQQTGENFIDYLIKIRMERGKTLLHDTNLKTYQVGENVGYNNSKYFCKLFKNYTGYTPTEYRSKAKRSIT